MKQDSASILNRLKHVSVPWFAVAFLVVTCIYSTHVVPPTVVEGLVAIDSIFLAMAMGALGLRTRVSALRAAGPRPMILAFVLFMALLGEGLAFARFLG